MSKQKNYESIEAYLTGKLTEKEKAAFEKQLNQDTDFAMEVNLHKKVQAEIGDSTKRELRGILGDLKKQYAQVEGRDNIRQLKPRRSMARILSIAASVLLLGMAFWYFILKNPDEEQPIVQDIIEPSEETKPSEKTTTPEDVTPIDPSQLAQNDAPKQTPPIPEQTPDSDKQTGPMDTPTFDPFEVNPALEELVASSETTPFEFEVELPSPDMKLTRRNGKTQFGVLGTLFTSEFPEEDRFIVRVFNNQPDSYSNNQPAFKSKMNFEKAEDQQDIAFAGEERDIYYFDLRENLTVEPGLYYWIISLEKGETIVSSGKVLIEEQ